jgi:hypothetical protein
MLLALLAGDGLPFFGIVQLVELARVFKLALTFIGHQPQAAHPFAVMVVFIVPQRYRLHPLHGQPVAGQPQLQARLQALIELLAQMAVVGHIADGTAGNEFRRQLAHGRLQQILQMTRGDGAGRRHEVARKGRHLFDRQIDSKAGHHLELLGRTQLFELKTDGQRHARDQDFGMLIAQQVVEAGEKAFDLVFALRYFGGLVGLQDIGARHGRHAQCLGEDARQTGDAEIHGQLVIRRYPAVIAQHRRIARRTQRQAAVLAVARLAVVLLFAARTFDATKT